jgi:hypothetical protein
VSSGASVSFMPSLMLGSKRHKVSAEKRKPHDAKYNTLLHRRLRKYASYILKDTNAKNLSIVISIPALYLGDPQF